jgi:polycomb protein EED
MFQRFSLYPGSSTKNPVLAFSPSSSKVFFWDLTRLSGYYDYVTTVDQVEKGAHGEKGRPTEIPKRPPFLVPFRHRNRGSMLSAVSRVRETSPTDSSSSHHTGTENTHAFHSGGNSHPTASINTHGLSGRDLAKSKENWAKRYNIGNEWTNIAPHREEAVKTLDFVGRQIAWSNGGEWCVVVGSEGAMAIFERWAK